MAKLIEDTKGKIRDLPIKDSLRELLIEAATRSGIDLVRVTSGGQAAKGTPGKRTGSTRHDLGGAADLEIWLHGKPLSFVRPAELPFFESFVAEATALGATGIGAAVDYMGPITMHVGYGSPAVWGAGGKSANAPLWLRNAVAAGKSRAVSKTGTAAKPAAKPPAPPASPNRQFIVVARSGLNLRSGPGRDYPVVGALSAGTHVWSDAAAPGANDWVRVDTGNDGLFDGFVSAAYLAQV